MKDAENTLIAVGSYVWYRLAGVHLFGMPDWLDWEIILVVAMAAAGVAIMYADWRRDKDHASIQRELLERLVRLESSAAVHSPYSLVERMTDLEREMLERLVRIESSVAISAPHSLTERVSELEGWRGGVNLDMVERLAAVEVKLDMPASKRRRKRVASADTEEPSKE